MRWSCQVAGVGKKSMFYDSSLENAKKKKKKKKKRKKIYNVFKALVSATSPVVDQGIRHLWVHSLIRDFRIIAMNVKHAVVSFFFSPLPLSDLKSRVG